MKRQFPFIEWVRTADERHALVAIPKVLKQKYPNHRYELYLPDLSVFDTSTNKDLFSIFISLVRRVDRVHIYEEGIFAYTHMISHLVSWANMQQTDPVFRSVGMVDSYLKLPATEVVQGKAEPFFYWPKSTYYLSKLSAVPAAKRFEVAGLDLAGGWKRLRETDRSILRSFFKWDRSSLERVKSTSPKPDMLMIGSVAASPSEEIRMERWIQYVVRKHAAKYDLFFKPHPRDLNLVRYVTAQFPSQISVLATANFYGRPWVPSASPIRGREQEGARGTKKSPPP